MSKRLEITLGKDGSVKTEAKGFKGPECLKAAELLNELYGAPETTEEKDSMHEVSETLSTGVPSGWCG